MKLWILTVVLLATIDAYSTLSVSFISWNVNDNKRFNSYSTEIVAPLLQLDKVKKLSDFYAITLQEGCLHCNKDNWAKISDAFVRAIEEKTGLKYKLISMTGTRKSSICETVYCLGMHGSTMTLVLVSANLSGFVSHVFTDRVKGCTKEWIGNNEKGIAVVGFLFQQRYYCFGGLHLDLRSVEGRRNCVSDSLSHIRARCDYIFYGGDFNTRPQSKTTPVSSYFNEGRNSSYLHEMLQTDDLAGSRPFSGSPNLLQYIKNSHQVVFSEPFGRAPSFLPTYSINAEQGCQLYPVCYEHDRYPSWTDRIIYFPADEIICSDYSSINDLGKYSDHLPVIAHCIVN